MGGRLMNDELDRMWKEAVVACFKPEGTEENHEEPQSGLTCLTTSQC
jgi:hypothetical protein